MINSKERKIALYKLGMILGIALMIISAFGILGYGQSNLLSETFDYPDGTLVKDIPTHGPISRGPPYFIIYNNEAQCNAVSSRYVTVQEFGLRTWNNYHFSGSFRILQLNQTDPTNFYVTYYFRAFTSGGYGDRINVDFRGTKGDNTWLLASEVGGNWYSLAQARLPSSLYLQIGKTYIVDIEVSGSQIMCWLNKTLLFNYDEYQFVPNREPSVHLTGSVALGNCLCNVAFDNLLVTTTSVGRLNISCDVPATITINGIGSYTADMEIPSGSYQVTASYNGQIQDFQVTIEQNRRVNVILVFPTITIEDI